MTEPRWIKLSERKPENNQSCWIFTLEKQIFHGHYENHETFGNCFRSPRFALALSFAEYWMPCDMPPLPKEEKPVDPDWEKLKEQKRDFDGKYIDVEDFLAEIFIFLEAKYGNSG